MTNEHFDPSLACPPEKLLLLAGELLRDMGHETVTLEEVAHLFGSALGCAVLFEAPNPSDRELMTRLVTRTGDAAHGFQERLIRTVNGGGV